MNSLAAKFPLPDWTVRAPRREGALPVALLGVTFDPVSTTEAVERIADMIDRRRPHQVVTANLDFLLQAHGDPELRRILHRADLTLCDGTPLVWASRWLGNPLPERVAGADLVPRLLAQAAQRGHRVFLLGGTPAAGAEAAERIRARHPGIEIAGQYAPPFAPLDGMDHADIGRRIRAAKPDLLFVSFGCPKAEKWIARNYEALGVPVAIGVGATIDFLAGRMRRAPVWMQRGGMEWIFRMLQEPRRLTGRYAADFAFFGRALPAQWWRGQGLRAHEPAPPARVVAGETWSCLALSGWIDAGALRRDRALWENLAEAGRDCVVDLTQATGLDSSAAARLLRLQRHLQTAGRRLVLLAPGTALRGTLHAMHLGEFGFIARDFAEAWTCLQTATPALSAP